MERSDIQVLIDAIADGVPNTALKVRTVLNALADGTDQEGDVKEIDVSNAYLLANFDPTGLGINERVGWAICNGNNGTRNRLGRVPMQYSTLYPTLGAIGGEYEHTLTEAELPPLPAFPKAIADTDRGTLSSNFSLDINTSYGGGQPHNNMQPYIVTVFIMKLP